jgi:O-antigen/teichoic acid export membrane protein
VAATITPDTPVFESRQWLAGALGLVVLSGALFINSQIGTVLLGLLDEAESAGLYAVAQRGALLVAFPLLALNAAIAPTAARLWANGEVGQLQRLATLGARGVLLVSLPIAIAFVFAGEQLVTLVFGATFTGAALPLAILTLGQLVNAATGSVATLLMMTGEQRRAVVGIGVGLVLNLGLGMVLIPGYGATGAAIAASVGLVAANLIHTLMSRFSLGIDPTVVGLGARMVPEAAE